MIKLNKLLEEIDCLNIHGDDKIIIKNISYNSITTEKGDLFISVKGFKEDGNKYIESAIENGAVT